MTDVTFRPSGSPFTARIVRKGDSYGLNRQLVHGDDRPMVEFYDDRYYRSEWSDALGQFISRYYIDTLLTDRRPGVGLDLCGYEPQWRIDGPTMDWFVAWLRYQEWCAQRASYSELDGTSDGPTASEWHYSDDEAVDLLHEVMRLVGNPVTSP